MTDDEVRAWREHVHNPRFVVSDARYQEIIRALVDEALARGVRLAALDRIATEFRVRLAQCETALRDLLMDFEHDDKQIPQTIARCRAVLAAGSQEANRG